MSRRDYLVQSLHGLKDRWETIYMETSLKDAKTSARQWEADVKARRAAGKVHHSNGVRVIHPGDVADPFVRRVWGGPVRLGSGTTVAPPAADYEELILDEQEDSRS